MQTKAQCQWLFGPFLNLFSVKYFKLVAKFVLFDWSGMLPLWEENSASSLVFVLPCSHATLITLRLT